MEFSRVSLNQNIFDFNLFWPFGLLPWDYGLTLIHMENSRQIVRLESQNIFVVGISQSPSDSYTNLREIPRACKFTWSTQSHF